jgi:hypothetical protein
VLLFILCKKRELYFSITANELKRNGVAGIKRVMLDNNKAGVRRRDSE